jgi:hypothetical protein
MEYSFRYEPQEVVELVESINSRTAAKRRALGLAIATLFLLVLGMYMYVEFSQRAAGKFPAKPGSGYVRHVWLEVAVGAVIVLGVIGRIRSFVAGIRIQRIANEMLLAPQIVVFLDGQIVREVGGRRIALNWNEFRDASETPSLVVLAARSHRILDSIGVPKRVLGKEGVAALIELVERRLSIVIARMK